MRYTKECVTQTTGRQTADPQVIANIAIPANTNHSLSLPSPKTPSPNCALRNLTENQTKVCVLIRKTSRCIRFAKRTERVSVSLPPPPFLPRVCRPGRASNADLGTEQKKYTSRRQKLMAFPTSLSLSQAPANLSPLDGLPALCLGYIPHNQGEDHRLSRHIEYKILRVVILIKAKRYNW